MTDTSKDLEKAREWHAQTRQVHGGTQRSQFGETSESIFLTSGYIYENAEQAEARFKEQDDGFAYSRFENPTVQMFEDRMCLLEGANLARATATGMAAVTSALLSALSAGDHIVAAKALFGSCRYVVETLCPRLGITSTLVDGESIDAWKDAIQPNTKAFFLETPSNPTVSLVDVSAVAALAKNAGARLIVDNVFATPILQKPLDLGADIVIYSATKHIDGQGRCLGGIVLSNDEEFILKDLKPFLRNTGPTLSPFNAWVLLKSLETLDLRVHRHCDNAELVAEFLADHPLVTQALYPGRSDHPQRDLATKQMLRGGNVVAFEIEGGKERAFKVANKLEIIRISNNLGDAKSLITHPSTTTHSKLSAAARAELGIRPGLLRLSVGLENGEDLCRDLQRAFNTQ